MNPLAKRVAKLEADRPDTGKTAIAWSNIGQSDDDALNARFGEGPRPKKVIIIGWRDDDDGLDALAVTGAVARQT